MDIIRFVKPGWFVDNVNVSRWWLVIYIIVWSSIWMSAVYCVLVWCFVYYCDTYICLKKIQVLFNILKPTSHVMHQPVLTFNNCTLCPHCIYVFCIYLRRNSDLCHLQHKLIGFYSLDEKCLRRGTDWGLKWSSLYFVCKGLSFLTP